MVLLFSHCCFLTKGHVSKDVISLRIYIKNLKLHTQNRLAVPAHPWSGYGNKINISQDSQCRAAVTKTGYQGGKGHPFWEFSERRRFELRNNLWREGERARQLPIPERKDPNLKMARLWCWRLDCKSGEFTCECWDFWSIWYDKCWVKHQKTASSATSYFLQRNDAQTSWLAFKSLSIISQPILTAIAPSFLSAGIIPVRLSSLLLPK